MRQKISARPTDESASGSWPTPTKRDYGSSQNGSNSSRPSAGTPSISTRVKSWPTPLHSDATAGGCRPDATDYHRQVRDVVHNWPTPTKTDAWDSARHTTTTGVMHPGTMSLDAVRDFYSSDPTGHPAPTQAIPGGTTGSPEPPVVNPAFVARLMGLPQDWLSAVPIPDQVVEMAYEKLRKEKRPAREDDDEPDETPSGSTGDSSSSPASETASSRRSQRRRS